MRQRQEIQGMPRPPGLIRTDDAYWDGIAAQYVVSQDFINLENGYFGIEAEPVFAAFQRYQREIHDLNSAFLRLHWPQRLAHVMQVLARFCGVSPEELHVTRNAVESMNILVQGYPFKPGEAILMAQHDYDSVGEAADMVAERKSLSVRRIAVPLDPQSDGEIVSLYEQALTPSTRVIVLTHIVHRTGQIMPVARIAAMARARGVDVFVDSAHAFAQLDIQLPELGVDFIGANLHKWLGAPLGVGLLYIRRERVRDIAPLFGDRSHALDDIRKFSHVGTVPPASILAIEDAIAFHEQIGSANKEARLRELKEYWVGKARSIPRVTLLTPRDPQRACAIAAFRIEGMQAQAVADLLLRDHGIFTVVREIEGGQGVRVTPHLYTSKPQLDRLVQALQQITASL
jgi:selenocysteine lyase/cysteine desulfurase